MYVITKNCYYILFNFVCSAIEGCKQKCERAVTHYFDSFFVTSTKAIDMSKSLLGFVLQHAAQLTKVKNTLGQTPLSLACKLQLPAELIELLLQADVSIINEPDNLGYTPLHHCKSNIPPFYFYTSQIKSHCVDEKYSYFICSSFYTWKLQLKCIAY
jgi:hypothetical protein